MQRFVERAGRRAAQARQQRGPRLRDIERRALLVDDRLLIRAGLPQGRLRRVDQRDRQLLRRSLSHQRQRKQEQKNEQPATEHSGRASVNEGAKWGMNGGCWVARLLSCWVRRKELATSYSVT